jgi:hypothetical protein
VVTATDGETQTVIRETLRPFSGTDLVTRTSEWSPGPTRLVRRGDGVSDQPPSGAMATCPYQKVKLPGNQKMRPVN